MTQAAVASSSTCESKNSFSEPFDIASTNDYLELNRKYIENVAEDAVFISNYPESRIEHDGLVYFSNADGLFFRQQNATTTTKINGFPAYTNVYWDKKFNSIYLGTNTGLSRLEYGERMANKIIFTDGIAIDFGVVDYTGDVYFGNNGENGKSSEEMYVLRKKGQVLVKIIGIEQSHSSYTIESISNPNKIAVDTKNNVYVGAYSGYIYLIESGQTKASKLKDIKSYGGVTSVVVDSKDIVYFRTNHALYTLKGSEKKLTKIFELIDDFNYFLSVDKNDNLYFQIAYKTYVLKSQAVTATEIDKVSTSNGYTATNFGNLQNFQVKNEILYFTSTNNGTEIIFAMKRNETAPTEVHRTDNSIISLAIDTSHNIYFVSFSDELQKLVPFILRQNSDTPIEIRGVTGHLSSVFADNQNNIFFGSGNGLHVLQDGEVTPIKIRATESQISSFVVDMNDNVYFGTDDDGAFVLKTGDLEATKIDGVNTKFGSYVEVYGDRKYDVVYLKTGGALYKLNGGESAVVKIIEGFSPDLFLSNFMNDTYYVQTNDEHSSIFSVKCNDTAATRINDNVGKVLYMNSDSFNNLYFITDNNQLQMLRNSELTPIILAENQKLSSLNVDQDDNVYFTADGEVYVLRSGNVETTKIHNIYGEFQKFVSNGDDILLITTEKRMFLVRNKLPFDATFKNRFLGEIDNNDDETIFNILNYLNVQDNYLLSKSKNKVVDKTATSATVVATDGKFKGKFSVGYTINDKNDGNERNFELLELLERATFFDNLNKNLYNFNRAKEIQNISVSTKNLKFFPVEATTILESISTVEFKNICFNKKKVANTSPLAQTIKVPACNYEAKEIISFQVTNGLNKTNSFVGESVASLLNADDENAILNFVNINDNRDGTAKVTLSNAFDLSNLNKHIRETVLHNFVEDEQDIIVPPKQHIVVKYSVRTFVSETNLNLKQRIRGTLVAKIRYSKSEETIQITIKEAMQTLEKYNLMPSEISINEDNSVNFNGRAKLIVKRESEPKIIRNFHNV